MKRYKIMAMMCSITLGAFSGGRNNNVSMEDKLTIVLVHHGADKKDKEGKEHIRRLQKAFDSFKSDRSLRRIGVAMKVVDLSKDTTFADRYLEGVSSNKPMILFFRRGDVLEDEMCYPESDKELTKELGKKLHNAGSTIGKIIQELEDDYEEQRERDREAARLSTYSIMYPSAFDSYYNGWYSPFYPRHTYWVLGWTMGCHRHW